MDRPQTHAEAQVFGIARAECIQFPNPAQQATLDAALAKSLQAIPVGTPKTDGAAFGASVAERVFAISREDGAAATVDYDYGKLP
jgi:hypothetical protein